LGLYTYLIAKRKTQPARNASPARIATQSVAGGHSDAGGSAKPISKRKTFNSFLKPMD